MQWSPPNGTDSEVRSQMLAGMAWASTKGLGGRRLGVGLLQLWAGALQYPAAGLVSASLRDRQILVYERDKNRYHRKQLQCLCRGFMVWRCTMAWHSFVINIFLCWGRGIGTVCP